ncbi:hypothetical protein [Streptomyces siamensis]|uniref:hypothetical protein n=1 Tax=Streptomyces siamensis TaxID=1274986 RepID=UPI0031EC4784
MGAAVGAEVEVGDATPVGTAAGTDAAAEVVEAVDRLVEPEVFCTVVEREFFCAAVGLTLPAD